MPIVTQYKWDGGHADDIRTPSIDECESSVGFDILSNPYKLVPFPDSVAETHGSGTIADIQTADVDVTAIGSDYKPIAIGENLDVSADLTFYKKYTSDISSVWAKIDTVAGSYTLVKRSLVFYKGEAYAVGLNGTSYRLFKLASDGFTLSTIGTVTTTTGNFIRPFVHPLDNILYMVIGTTISTYDGTTFATNTSILPSGMNPSSITDYGQYLAIAMYPKSGNGSSIVYLWGRDTTINTLQGVINFGEGIILVLENLDNMLFAVTQTQGNFSRTLRNKVVIKQYAGGAVNVLKTLTVTSGSVITKKTVQTSKVKNDNKIYFCLNNDDAVYIIAKNKSGRYIVTKERYYQNGTVNTPGTFSDVEPNVIISMIGDTLWVSMQVTGSYTWSQYRSKSNEDTLTYATSSVYKTLINTNMPLDDRYKLKHLKSVQIAYTGKTSGTIKVKYSVDGSAMADVISEITTAIEDVKQASQDTSGNPLLSGREFQFQIESTGGVEIKELKYEYTVLNSAI